MKKDLITAIVAAIAGFVIAFLITNVLTPPIESFSYTTVDSSIGVDYAQPNPEIFNFRSLNPTVEVFVGDCTEFDENGECLDEYYNQENDDILDEDEEDNSDNQDETNPSEEENEEDNSENDDNESTRKKSNSNSDTGN